MLLEGCAGQTYFDFVSAIAHQHRKVVIRLESGKSQVHDVGFTVAAGLAIYTGGGNIPHFLRRGVDALSYAASRILSRLRSEDNPEDEEYSAVDGPSISRTLFTGGALLITMPLG